ncbi:hypothetical protein BDF20DRAFT_899228 [Mycotypha africana]|uniref:uncharacterized protein n=1 Tax=Mycotypha africana TaxID=64632 RepID=UPI002300E56D|nr:uncharacterized protein BDF20DRAFT_899228 [Mycotypha africana]KAI8967786.1 hypothetical protein BDF20DRAFT_899228 [Mycotypha africana]
MAIDANTTIMTPITTPTATVPTLGKQTTVCLPVIGMTCHSCVHAIKRALSPLVQEHVHVDLQSHTVTITFDPAQVTVHTLIETIQDCGFDVPIPEKEQQQQQQQQQQEQEHHKQSLDVSILGMTCSSCVQSITKACQALNGLHSVDIDLDKAKGSFSYQPTLLSPQTIIDTIQDCGFQVPSPSTDTHSMHAAHTMPSHPPSPTSSANISTSIHHNIDHIAQLRIQGMTCASCVHSIEKSLSVVQGVHSIEVALLAESATVHYDPAVIQVDDLVNHINDIGFEATCISDTDTASPDTETSSHLQLQIYGMTCASCVHSIERHLRAQPGIQDISVSLMTESASVRYDPACIGPRQIIDAIDSLGGFHAFVSDKARHIQLESLSKVREIRQWRRLLLQSLVFAIPVFVIAMVLPECSWGRALVHTPTGFLPGLFWSDLLQWILATPVQFIIGKRFLVSAYQSLKHKTPTMDVLVALSTLSAYFFSLLSIVRAVIQASLSSSDASSSLPVMKPPVFFDTSTMLIAFILAGRYLENMAKGQSSSALSKLMSLTPSNATLVELAPTEEDTSKRPAVILSEKQIPSELIQTNDHLKILPGDKIPTDGVLVSGATSVNESMITGESEPVNKHVGDTVIGGTVNGLGTFVMRATRVGAETALSQIVRLVEDAQMKKAPIQGFTDRVAGVFVPVVLVLGLATLVVWSLLVACLGVERMPPLLQHEISQEGQGDWFFVCLKLCISVVIVACPCALGLATPTAIMVGTGLAAEHGVLFKGGAVLENGQKVTKVVFDKTGTLTTGQVQVVQYQTWHHQQDPAARLTMLIEAALAEANSEHLLGRAIVQKAKELTQQEKSLDHLGSVEHFKSVTGYGIECTVTLTSSSTPSTTTTPSHHLVIGNQAWLEQHHGIALTNEQGDVIRKESSMGRTSILVATDGVPTGFISIADVIKPEAKLVIQALMRMGIDTAMVTGDNALTAQCIADRLGITEVHAGVSPQGKTHIIQQMQAERQRKKSTWLPSPCLGGPRSLSSRPAIVAMVGDGINDSPALVASNLGIALCSGTDIAIDAADVVLMRNDLTDVVTALSLSKSIFRRIQLNLLWACIYNLIGIPLAMGLFMPLGLHLHPMMAGIAMAASSTSVVLSSLMLRWFWRKTPISEADDFEVKKNHPLLRQWQQWWTHVKGGQRGAYHPLSTVAQQPEEEAYDLESLSPR